MAQKSEPTIGGLDAKLFIGRMVKAKQVGAKDPQPGSCRMISCEKRGARLLMGGRAGEQVIPYEHINPWWSQNPDLKQLAEDRNINLIHPPRHQPELVDLSQAFDHAKPQGRLDKAVSWANPPPARREILKTTIRNTPADDAELPEPTLSPAPILARASQGEPEAEHEPVSMDAGETPLPPAPPPARPRAVNTSEDTVRRKILGVEIDFDRPAPPGFDCMRAVDELRKSLNDLEEAEAMRLEAQDNVDRLIEQVADAGVLIKWAKQPEPRGNIPERIRAWIDKEGRQRAFTAKQALKGADLPFEGTHLAAFHRIRKEYPLIETQVEGQRAHVYKWP